MAVFNYVNTTDNIISLTWNLKHSIIFVLNVANMFINSLLYNIYIEKGVKRYSMIEVTSKFSNNMYAHVYTSIYTHLHIYLYSLLHSTRPLNYHNAYSAATGLKLFWQT